MKLRYIALPIVAAATLAGCAREASSRAFVHIGNVPYHIEDIDRDGKADIMQSSSIEGGSCFYAPGYDHHCPVAGAYRAYPMSEKLRKHASHILGHTEAAAAEMDSIREARETSGGEAQ